MRKIQKKIRAVYRIIHRGSILLALIGLFGVVGECRAFPYRPAAALIIVSEYTVLNSSAPSHTQNWKVVPESAPDGATILRFFLDTSGEAVIVCELRLPSAGIAEEIRWEGMGKTGHKKNGVGFLLVPGFPAPCDVLPVGREESGAVFEERIEAGGRVFSKRYRVSLNRASVEEAKASGWIKGEDSGTTELIMVSVTDDKERLVVKQLWPGDGSWWLYEETPLRRSWLIH